MIGARAASGRLEPHWATDVVAGAAVFRDSSGHMAARVGYQPPSAVRTAWAAAAARSSVGRTPPTSWT